MMPKKKTGPGFKDQAKEKLTYGFSINEKIKAKEMRVIGDEGENLGILSLDDAIMAARSRDMDLVQIGKDKTDMITAKIMDFGKFVYEKKKQANIAKKKQKVIEIKEIKMRPVIDEGDYQLKIKKVVEFLEEGDHVKVTLQFKGREALMKATSGNAMFERIFSDVRERLTNYSIEYQKETGNNSLWTKILIAKKTSK